MIDEGQRSEYFARIYEAIRIGSQDLRRFCILCYSLSLMAICEESLGFFPLQIAYFLEVILQYIELDNESIYLMTKVQTNIKCLLVS